MKSRIGSISTARPLLLVSGIAPRLTKSQVGNSDRVLCQPCHSDVPPTATCDEEVQIALSVLYIGRGA